MSNFFKKITKGVISAILVIFVVAFTVFGLIINGIDLWQTILKVGDGSWIKGIISLPLCLIGAIQIFRGFFNNIEKDNDWLNIDSTWKAGIYLLVNILGYIALVDTLQIIF